MVRFKSERIIGTAAVLAAAFGLGRAPLTKSRHVASKTRRQLGDIRRVSAQSVILK